MTDSDQQLEAEPTRFQKWRYSSLFYPSLILLFVIGIFIASAGWTYYRNLALSWCVAELGGRSYELKDELFYRFLELQQNRSGDYYREIYMVSLQQTEISLDEFRELAMRMGAFDRRGFKLELSHCQIKDVDFGELQQYPNVIALHLTGCGLSEEQVRQVGTLNRLVELDLSRSEISTAGLQAVATLPYLNTLILDHVPLTEEQLLSLGKLASLKSLSLTNTGLTEKSIKSFSLAYPGVEISDD